MSITHKKMYNKDSVVKGRIEFLTNQLETIRDDFRTNLKPKLIKYEHSTLTKVLLENIQSDINFFLERNELKISVYVTILDQELVILGISLIDQLVWEQIIK